MTKHIIFKLIPDISASIAIKVFGAATGFAGNILLARILGVEQFGIYTLIIAWVYLAIIPARLGFDQSSTPAIAKFIAIGDAIQLKSYMLFALVLVCCCSLSFVSIIGIGFTLFCPPSINGGFLIYIISAAIVITLSIGQFMESSLRGFGLVVYAWMPLSVIHPASLVMFFVCSIFVLSNSRTADTAALCLLLSLCAGLIPLAVVWMREYNKLMFPVKFTAKREWVTTGLSMIVGGSFSILVNQTTTLLTGIGNVSDAGEFGAAIRLSNVLPLVYGTVTGTISYRFSQLWAVSDFDGFRKLVITSAVLTICSVIPIAIFGWIFADLLINLFGAEYHGAIDCFRIMLIYQCILAFGGLGITILNMIGRHGIGFYLVLSHIFLNIPVSYVLISGRGSVGAAWSLTLVAISLTITAWPIVLRQIGGANIFKRKLRKARCIPGNQEGQIRSLDI